MIQFNLLPDVKLNYVKTKKLKNTISVISVIVAAAGVTVMVILLVLVNVVQKKQITNLNNQVNSGVSKLQSTPNINDILTLQAELNSISTLHSDKPVVSRINGFLYDLVPLKAKLTQLNISFTSLDGGTDGNNSLQIQGTADNLNTVNQFVDILKLTSYQTSTSTTQKNAFSNVVLTSASYQAASGAGYNISANFDPMLFSEPTSNVVTLTIPANTITHSTAVESQDLFAAPATTNNGQGN